MNDWKMSQDWLDKRGLFEKIEGDISDSYINPPQTGSDVINPSNKTKKDNYQLRRSNCKNKY